MVCGAAASVSLANKNHHEVAIRLAAAADLYNAGFLEGLESAILLDGAETASRYGDAD